MSSKVHTGIRITEYQYKKLKDLAEEKTMKLAEYIRYIIDIHLDSKDV